MRPYVLPDWLCYAAPVFKRLSFILFCYGLPALAAGQDYDLSALEWAQPRNGHAITQMQPVQGAVRQLLATPTGVLQIRYPGGDEGSVWAHELKGWLVALGVDSDRIELVPGSAAADMIQLRIMNP